jgi:hypothetical protein
MIDKNVFKKPDEIMMNLWCKYSPQTFKGKTKEQLAIETISESPIASSLLDDAQRFKSLDSTSVEQKSKAITNQLISRSGLEGEKLSAAKEYIRKTLYTNHGIRNEEKTANIYPNFKSDDTFYHYEVCTIEGTKYEIVGRVDRLTKNDDGTLTIVEIKNRAKYLFNTVREYEEIQCQTYMEMLNLDTCKLIEQYNDQICSHLIYRKKEEWNTQILPKLRNFCECFHSLLSS